MHKIDLHNYEAYLLDFSEGNLSDENQMELELFLIQHPELNIDLDELSLVTLENEAATFSNKNSLKKAESDLISGNQFISYIENQLSADERLVVEKSCAVNPLLKKELNFYKNSIVKTDETIVFQNKNELKRKPKIIWFNFSATQYAAAACVMFLIGLFMLWPKTDVNSDNITLAEKTDVAKSNILPSVKNNATNSQNVDQVLTNTEKTNTSLAQHLPVNTTKKSATNTTIAQQHNITFTKDTINNIINNAPVVEFPKNEILIALNVAPVAKQQTVVQVITENDDELVVVNTNKKKKGIWETASRALKNLNHAGVKGVNGDEESTKENTSYALTLGGVNITHKAGL